MFSNFFEYLQYFDLFKSPLTLLFDKKHFISTKFGLSCSIIIFTLIITLLCNSDVFEKTTPLIVVSHIPSSKIKLTQKIIAIGLKDDNSEGFIDPLVYSLKISNVFQRKNSSGDVLQEKFRKELKKCEDIELKDLLCLEEGENSFELEGFCEEFSCNFGVIELFLCDNSTNNNTCKSIEEIKKKLHGKRFDFYYENIIVDSSNFMQPLRKIIEKTHQFIDFDLKKTKNFFFEKVHFKTDEGLLFKNDKIYEEIQEISKESDFFLLSSEDLKSQGSFLCCFLMKKR